MTNGDYNGKQTGYARQVEAVNGEESLGVAENNLIFLGYPDGGLTTILNNYQGQTDKFVSRTGISQTYGNRGLGSMDYHTYRFGAPGFYNKYNIVMDLEDIFASYKPDHILVTSEFDAHTDHSATYQLVKTAASRVNSGDPTFAPTIHKTIIWWTEAVWPGVSGPTTNLPEITGLHDATGLQWVDRESIDVPRVMQIPLITWPLPSGVGNNLKYRAIYAHATQAYDFHESFIHKDEIFWTEKLAGTNNPPHVNAGADQEVREGQSVQLDGSQSRDADGNPLVFRWVQRSGLPVQLTNPAEANPTFTAPADLTRNEELTFELTVSDGGLSSIADAVKVTVLATNPFSNIAPLATVTASSQNVSAGQTALKAVDGVIDGAPHDFSREWVTNGEKTGAWLKLHWGAAYIVNRVVLYDRPSLSNNILSATLTFSDGATLSVGAVEANGTATEITFPARVITGMTVTVTGVASGTQSVGLAELQVFGKPANQTQYTLTLGANPAGAGSIAASPSKTGYYQGEQVTLAATAGVGYGFSSWSGDAAGTTNPVVVTVSGNLSVTANYTAIPGTLSVTPATGLSFSGYPGGSFTPASAIFTLQNIGSTELNWQAAATQNWLTLSSTSGTLNPGASATEALSINGSAGSLPVGSYSDTVTFTNATNGNGNTARGVNLSVSVPPQVPDLTLAKTHSVTRATYTITVSNSGTSPTVGAVTVTETLPVGLTATAMSGSGWTCTLATLTCTRSSALAAGASFPPITVQVTVASSATETVINTATVSGGGDGNTANNTAGSVMTVK